MYFLKYYCKPKLSYFVPRPPVDILIPFHGQYELVTRAVTSILHCTPNQQYTIFLVDDASPNEYYLEIITSLNKKIKGVRLSQQVGFAGALQAGFNAGNSPCVVFFHSDCRIESIHWLSNLQRALGEMKNEGVKLVSARTNDPGTAASYDTRLIGDNDPDNVQGERNIVTDTPTPLFCSLCHRELFQHIGGFLKPYPYAWYEDEELYWRMKYYRYKQGIAAASYVFHEGAATIKQLWAERPQTRESMESNQEKCLTDIKLYRKIMS